MVDADRMMHEAFRFGYYLRGVEDTLKAIIVSETERLNAAAATAESLASFLNSVATDPANPVPTPVPEPAPIA